MTDDEFILKNFSPAKIKEKNQGGLDISINVVLFFLGPKTLYRSVIFSRNEVFCSPHCETEMDGDRFVTIKTPSGVFDIQTILQQLPPSQKPDLVVVKADATGENFPINLSAIACPKLLICGNTQHLFQPIQTLLDYALQEQFDFILSDHKRHHLHYFKEAGFEKVFWVPGFNVNPHPPQDNLSLKYPLSFVGQVGRFHPYRKYILADLKQHDFPLTQRQAPPEKAAEIYAESLINLNISLNGDLNLRVFEVLSSGGFLLTDRLSQESGLELIFKPGQHLEVFGNASELQDKIAYFLNEPEATQEIARKGCLAFWENHRPEVNVQRVLDYISSKGIEPIYEIERDRRSVCVQSQNLEELRERISIYEYLQELHLNQPQLKILFWPKVDARILCDAVDLPRLEIHQLAESNTEDSSANPLFAQCEIGDRITFTASSELNQIPTQWDAIALTWDELQIVDLDALLERLNFKWLLFADAANNIPETAKQILNDRLDRRGFVKDSEQPLAYHWQRKSDWGNFLASQQKYREAIDAFERGLQDNSGDVTAAIEWGLLCFQLNDFATAEQLLRHAVSLERRNPEALENLAKVLMALNRDREAIAILEHLLFIKPEVPSLWLLLENCYQRSGQEQKALTAYRQYRKLREAKTLAERAIAISEGEKLLQVSIPAKTSFKRILVINNLYPPQELGGYGRSLFDFANLLRQRGHTLQVLTSDAPYLGKITAPEPHIDRSLLLFGTFEGETKPIADSTEISRIIDRNQGIIAEIVEEFSPEVCLVGNINFLGPEIFHPFLEKSIPVIHHLGLPTLLSPAHTMPINPLFTLATASEYVKQKVIEQGYESDDMVTIYPGVWVEKFKMCLLPNFGKLRIVYAGLLISSKGPQTLLQALKILHDNHIDFECSVAGDSFNEELFATLKEFVVRHGMNEKIKFVGYLQREELIELYSTKNVIVFPSIGPEAFGISPVEGMAAGLTALTTGVGGAGEVIEDNVSGLRFPAADSVALANALVSLLEDRERWKSLAIAGQERAREMFDIHRSADLLEAKFEELLQRRNRDNKYLENTLLPQLKENLRLREINAIVFPDWSQSEESVALELERAIATVMTHPKSSQMTLLIHSGDISEEEANLIVSGVVMNLLMQEELEEVTEEPEISAIGKLSEIEWEGLLPRIGARIILECENREAIAAVAAWKIQALTLDAFSHWQGI